MSRKSTNRSRMVEILFVLVAKEIKLRYKRTFLGLSWIFIMPLLQILTLGFIFSFFINVPNYYLFLLSGILVWNFFAQALSRAVTSFFDERDIMHKSNFPRWTIPVSLVLASFLHYLASTILLTIYFALFERLNLTSFIFIMSASIWLATLVLFLSLFLSVMQLIYRDTEYITRFLLSLGFYITPVIYNFSFIPSGYSSLLALNPLVSILELVHSAFFHGGLPDVSVFYKGIVSTIAISILGTIVYIRNRKNISDLV